MEIREQQRAEENRRNELLSRDDIERDYRGITRRWLELAALSGNGPPMIKISPRMVRYQRGIFEDWLSARTVRSTSEQMASSA
ncbi:MAG: AlpA family transcriptional regulator [Rhodobacteraceae bacterium]|nr:AlpA family transcriptional regulator [Paracoccaceae bacterium]